MKIIEVIINKLNQLSDNKLYVVSIIGLIGISIFCVILL